ncbi:hypothetical protein BEWA_034240 [Theileria equi strain WA]|uniref:Signal peptide containing protein n=1 Tax=Theileria equi strain WA TaxID=1537102 RepID=L0AYA6_THEEQ|nr:hypothetical protein BEWA_034240 [Theileria equi strain WA]AFZ80567.1 hypothetical protein BEWA_034240 [Theileria equi strain WA]|eukprot:XP_004830233.1 hypothetical protein BEWA_034240 [Theileria equi strain WA]
MYLSIVTGSLVTLILTNTNVSVSFIIKDYKGLGGSYLNGFSDANNHSKKGFFHSRWIPAERSAKLRPLYLSDDSEEISSEVDHVFENIRDIHELIGPYITKDGKIINKKRKLYSIGDLSHVDDMFIGKFRVEWTVRGVKEKLQFRHRDTKSPPLKSNRFNFSGIGGFILKLWLDGHNGSKDKHIAISLLQEEHWASLDSPICIFAGNIVRGPFYYRSPDYVKYSASLCRLEEALEDNTLRVGVMIAER